VSPRFEPPLLLRHHHLQTLLASSAMRGRRVLRQSAALRRASEPVIVPCADGVRLLALHTPPRVPGPPGAQRTAVLLHGWEGSADSYYLLSLAQRLWQAGYRVVRLNFRDHGDSHHLNREVFHSCRLAEVVQAVAWIRDRYAAPVCLAGFSLGGNFSLRVAVALGPGAGLQQVVAVCPVLDPAATMVVLDGGSRIYQRYFMWKWRRSLRRKAALFPGLYDFGPLDRFQDLHSMTEHLVTRYTEYPQLDAYLQGYAITGGALAALAVPATALLAEDDPVIPVADAARLATPGCLKIVRTPRGGHCGFIKDYRLASWADDFILARFAAVDAASPASAGSRSLAA
jgi:uncharacterized protein